METSLARNTFLQRLIGALSLDVAIYEEVEGDRQATRQAFLVVLASSLAAGIGFQPPGQFSWSSVIFFTLLALASWMAWALLTFEIGTRILPGARTRSDVGELLRTLGFAATPGLLRVLGIMPAVMAPVFVITTVWMLAAMVVAVRQALDYRSTGRAIAVCVMGFVLSSALAAVIGLVFGRPVS